MTIETSFCKVTGNGYKSEIGAHCSRYLISIEQFQVLNIRELSLNYLNQPRTTIGLRVKRDSHQIRRYGNRITISSRRDYADGIVELLKALDGYCFIAGGIDSYSRPRMNTRGIGVELSYNCI